MRDQFAMLLAVCRTRSTIDLVRRAAELADQLEQMPAPNPRRQMLYTEWLACDLILTYRSEHGEPHQEAE